jgi:single-stranded-DNA-specific exonuclease
MTNNWIINTADPTKVGLLAEELGIHPITAGILLGRGVTSADDARTYLNPELSNLPDPFELPGMAEAVKTIGDAIEHKKGIAIFGDYDVDGVTASALLALFLRSIGTDPIVMLPSRSGHGYGLAPELIDELQGMGTELLITVDNGTKSIDEVAHARSIGMDVVVTDHHDVGNVKPDANALVNPKLIAKGSPIEDLCGCGVVFMLTLALRKTLREKGLLPDPEPNLKRHLDLVALGTIADIVPLTGINRILVKHGLFEMSKTTKPGIQSLLRISGTNPLDIKPGSISFRIAPRINAAGRVGEADAALELMLSEDTASADVIAKELDRANSKRQKLEERVVKDVEKRIRENEAFDNQAGLVLHSRNWHIGVLGIVASKISRKHKKPTVIITAEGEPARGSARSANDIDLGVALEKCSDLLIRFGGHRMAAGLSINFDDIDEFARRFDEACRELTPETPPGINIDAIVAPDDITMDLVNELSSCQPFGSGNPEPVFAMEGMDIVDRRIVGDNHLKLKLGFGNQCFNAIAFGLGDAVPKDATKVSIVFVPEINTWNGTSSVQLRIKDITPN